MTYFTPDYSLTGYSIKGEESVFWMDNLEAMQGNYSVVLYDENRNVIETLSEDQYEIRFASKPLAAESEWIAQWPSEVGVHYFRAFGKGEYSGCTDYGFLIVKDDKIIDNNNYQVSVKSQLYTGQNAEVIVHRYMRDTVLSPEYYTIQEGCNR